MFSRRHSLKINDDVVAEIRRTVGALPAEQGGILGGDPTAGVVTHFHFDREGTRTGATYSPNAEALTTLLKEDWNPRGVRLMGFVHSHPPNYRRLSYGDEIYARRILDFNEEMKDLYLPLVMSTADADKFELLPFAVVRAERGKPKVELLSLKVVSGSSNLLVNPEDELAAIFDRVRGAYDVAWLSRCRVIAVGAGGANSWVDNMARTGVGEFILLDPDTVEPKNVGTQRVYLSEAGLPKVEVVRRRLLDINPQVKVLPLPMYLDEIDDSMFERLATAPWERIGQRRGHQRHGHNIGPHRTLLCGLTDNFEAQARINRLALQFGLPSLSAQVYREGRAAEITFTMPGVTPACQRCALRSRYEHYLDKGFRNDVTSNGTPIWSTERLNAIKGEIAMAILHHGTDHARYGGLLEKIGNRNLVQIRMDPNVNETLGLSVFDRAFAGADRSRVLTDETIWLPQEADRPEVGYTHCPDCGGTGDLRRAIGRFKDTRKMPRVWESEE